MKLEITETGLEISPESVTDKMYLKNVLGFDPENSSGLMVGLQWNESNGQITLKTVPQPDRIASIKIEIEGYGDKARFVATAKTLHGKDMATGTGDTAQEALGGIWYSTNQGCDMTLGVPIQYPCNADYIRAGLKGLKGRV